MDPKIWTEQEVQALIDNKAEENVHLEFKDGRALKQEPSAKKDLCKDVSALANSDGGVIIYGVSEDNHVASSLSFIDGSVFTKEWLELVLMGGTDDSLESFIIHPIRFDGDLLKTVYVIDVSVSPKAPHMVDNKYYKRNNFQVKPMDNWEVNLVKNRKRVLQLKVPQVTIKFANIEGFRLGTDTRVTVKFR